jgi:hypothetical protein
MKTTKYVISMMALIKIKPHPSHATIYLLSDVTNLKNSMQRLQEMLEPIILTKEGITLAGHRRSKAALELGWTHVPVRIVDIPEEDQIIYLIASNSKREKTWGERVAEIKAIYSYADANGKSALTKFLGNATPGITTRQLVAEVAGICEVYVSRLQKIAETDPHYIVMLDTEEVSFNEAFKACMKGKPPVPKTKATINPEKRFFCKDCPNKLKK